MESKHTPGPWSRNIKANGKYPTVFAGRNQHVAVVQQQKDGAETEANIDLVAAAPDLLAALESLFEHCAMVHKHWGKESNAQQADAAQAAARAAIAKARGQ